MMDKPLISPGVMARIRARHPDIPQDTIPGLETLADESRSKNSDPDRKKYVPSIRSAKCPKHQGKGPDDLTGVIVTADGVERFRDHTMRVGKQSVRCPGSGMVAP